MPTVTLWQRDSLHVTVSGGVDGLTFHAQDLDPPPMFGDEYEYGFSIAAADIPKLIQTRGGSAPRRYWNSSRQVPSLLPQRCRIPDQGP